MLTKIWWWCHNNYYQTDNQRLKAKIPQTLRHWGHRPFSSVRILCQQKWHTCFLPKKNKQEKDTSYERSKLQHTDFNTISLPVVSLNKHIKDFTSCYPSHGFFQNITSVLSVSHLQTRSQKGESPPTITHNQRLATRHILFSVRPKQSAENGTLHKGCHTVSHGMKRLSSIFNMFNAYYQIFFLKLISALNGHWNPLRQFLSQIKK